MQAVMTDSGEPGSPDDVLDGLLATEAARSLGVEVAVEPRDLALERLYESESRFRDETTVDLPTRVERLVSGVLEASEALDEKIEGASQHWSVARMPMIDRAILRLGLWELINDTDTPTAVIVSEAVRLANTYSTGRSGSFINGVLATLAKSVREDAT